MGVSLKPSNFIIGEAASSAGPVVPTLPHTSTCCEWLSHESHRMRSCNPMAAGSLPAGVQLVFQGYSYVARSKDQASQSRYCIKTKTSCLLVMTRHGKCDTCRKRKIKCDETKPICSPCERSRLACSYLLGPAKTRAPTKFIDMRPDEVKAQHESLAFRPRNPRQDSTGSSSNGNPETSAVLTLRSTSKPVAGDGAFHKFSLLGTTSGRKGSKKSPERDGESRRLIRESELLGKSTNLVLRWRTICKAIAPGESEAYAIGEWMEIIPTRIGHSSTVDAALDCFVNSAVAYASNNEQNMAHIFSLNAKALAGVRSKLLVEHSKAVQDDALLAISFLGAAEMLRGAKAPGHKIHMRGRQELLANVSKAGTDCTMIFTQHFFIIGQSEFMMDVMLGRDSMFDTSAWLALSAPPFANPDYPASEMVEEHITRQFVRLPRLIRLVRAARYTPENRTVCRDATSLAALLYYDTLDDWVDQVMEMDLVEVVPTIASMRAPWFESSFHFSSVRLYKRLLHYWFVRTIVGGCVLALQSIAPQLTARIGFDPIDVAEQDMQVAEHIAMSVQWAALYPSVFPFCSVMILPPLLGGAFSVWYRLEKRATTQAEVDYARNLQLWAIESAKGIGGNLNIPSADINRLRGTTEVMMGGPLPGSSPPSR